MIVVAHMLQLLLVGSFGIRSRAQAHKHHLILEEAFSVVRRMAARHVIISVAVAVPSPVDMHVVLLVDAVQHVLYHLHPCVCGGPVAVIQLAVVVVVAVEAHERYGCTGARL